jgi:endoglucanase
MYLKSFSLVKKILINTKLLIFCSITVALLQMTSCTKKGFPTTLEIKRSLGGGVNLSHFEHTWANPDDILKTDITPKLQQIAIDGFRTVRLPVAFDLYTYDKSSTLQPQLLTKLKDIYYTCYNLNLKLILTFHYGVLDENSQYNREIDHVSWIWKQVQKEFKGHGYDYLFFELYNEPTMNNAKWKTTAQKLISYIRHEDNDRIYIIGGSNYNGMNELMDMGKLNDSKLFYTFHYYEPYIFTHQGADWTSDKSFMTGFPYPYKRSKMPPYNPQANGSIVERDYKKYYYEATYENLQKRIFQVVDFCDKNNMPLVCTEFGVINVADDESRNNYIKDITKILNKFGVRAMIWDYDQKFGIKDANSNELKIKSVEKWLKKANKK